MRDHRPVLEALEPRLMMSATQIGGTLRVLGSALADQITITAGEQPGQIVVSGLDGEQAQMVFDNIRRIVVRSGGGDDQVTIESALNRAGRYIRAIVNAGAGDDTVTTGDGNDRILGRAGNDSLDAGDGRDVILGGIGDDIISGGLGNDRLFGQLGSDVFTGGFGNDRIFGGLGNDVLADYLLDIFNLVEPYLNRFGELGRLIGDAGRDLLRGVETYQISDLLDNLPEASPSPPANAAQTPVDACIADLAARIEVDPGTITVVSDETTMWPDSGLGLHEPGMVYLQVITPGHRIVLEADQIQYAYHTNHAAFVKFAGTV